MENTTTPTPPESPTGGRVSSAAYRHSLDQGQDFTGLEEGVDRYQLLLLVKKVGRAAGFTPRMIQLLDYYMAFTRDIDWEQGSRPIVYQSLARTALDMGVTERQIQYLERQLFEVGAMTWNDSGNHCRYGQRDRETGRILYAYGVDLTPLAYLAPQLQDKLAEKQLYDAAWLKTKRQISWFRRQLRGVLAEWADQGADAAHLDEMQQRYDELAVKIRTYMPLAQLRTLLARHRELHSEILTLVGAGTTQQKQGSQRPEFGKRPTPSSPRDANNFVPNKSTTQQSSDESDIGSRAGASFQESVVEPSAHQRETERRGTSPESIEEGTVCGEALILATGLQHITLRQVLTAMSDRFREQLPIAPRPANWPDVVEAAYRLRPQLQISQQKWREACGLLGRTGAAVCLLLTDRATQRADDPVRKPAAYFWAMVERARGGELRLHSSVLGLIEGASRATVAA